MKSQRPKTIIACDRIIEIAAIFLVLITPFFFVMPPSGHHVEKLVFSQLMILIMLLAWLVKMNESHKFHFARTPLNLPVISFLIVSAFSLLVAVNIFEGLNTLYRVVMNIILFFVLVNNIKEERQIRRIIVALVFGGLLVAVHGNLQSHGIDLPFFVCKGRAWSTFWNTNYVSQYLIVIIPVSLMMLLLSERKLDKLFFSISSILLLSHLIIAVCKGAWLGTLASFVVMGLLINIQRNRRKNEKKPILFRKSYRPVAVSTVVIALICFVILLGGSGDLVRQEWKSFFDTGYPPHLFRLNVWESTANMIREHPLLGVGIGNFRIVYLRYRNPNEELIAGAETVPSRAHNDYLQIASEIGLIGLGVFFWFVTVLYRIAIRFILQTKDRYYSMISIALIASITATLVHALSSFNLQGPVPLMFFWFTSGIIGAMGIQIKKLTSLHKAKPGFESATPTHKIRYAAVWVLLIGLITMMPIVTVRPLFAHLHKAKGITLHNKGTFAEAVQEYDKALRFQPSNIDVRFNRALALVHLHRYDQAIDEYEKILEFFPYLSVVYNDLGNLYSIKGFPEKAIEFYEKALKLSPNYGRAYYNLGNEYGRLGLWDKAIESYKAALKIGFKDAYVTHGALGTAYAENNLYDEAISEYEKAIEIQPNYAYPYFDLGVLYGEKLNNKKKGSYYLSMSIKLSPDSKIGKLAKRKLEEFGGQGQGMR